MKTAVSFNTVHRSNSGPGAMLRGAKWYWDEVTDMVAAAGFTSIALQMNPNTPTDTRNGAPICTDELREVYGSVEGYLAYLREKGIESVSAMMISAQNLLGKMQETGMPRGAFFEEFYAYAEDVCGTLKTLGGDVLLVSPTPAWGSLLQALGSEEALRAFEDDTAVCLNRIGAMSAAMGVHTCVKNDFWTLARGNGIRTFMEKVDRSLVSFAPDTAQLKIAEADAVELIQAYGSDMHCICLTDTRYKDQVDNYKSISPEFPQTGSQQRCYNDLGYGDVDFPAIYQALEAQHFDGLVILESRYTLNVPRAFLRMRTFWNRLTKRAGRR